MATLIVAALKDQIFSYVAANPKLETLPITIHNQFTNLGYSKPDINLALTDMVKSGSLNIDVDSGFISIGPDNVTAD